MLKKRRICRFCEEREIYIDYKDEKRLMRFITEQGKIIPRRTSGTCAAHQRMLVTAIKRARLLALMPFVYDQVR
ncbi:MAG: 30S ribosomal protein S18 [candidate division KSB1 bacterium]|nr:30S ribosomal protein S18 [candidate division KSB1 bacterium]MDZ7274779.1 30S ribosomal protein S18 [candidate division KSB1 bacterium]MDZ7285603.1 30S ribosomal protein S18 [candidate division KSB1 bacterium]MDZ7298635.1 30S ribosomal protein S18 [candidate division KSB1 bacterium]MDZ7307645.1 30S ribosomal protein S18 [candidate division KSB1 bacterium]